eukprot:c24113_g1_i1 orf=752-2830(+)
MDFAQISVVPPNDNFNTGERSLSSITSEGSEGTDGTSLRSLSQQVPDAMASSVNLAKHCRSSGDIDPHEWTGVFKMARTDCFTSGQKLSEHGSRNPTVFVRTDSMLSDGRLRCSPAHSTASDAGLLGNDFLMADAKPFRSDVAFSSHPFANVEACRTLSTGRSLSMPYHDYSMNSSGLGMPARDGLRMLSGQGPFTVEQLIELHQQTLIYKHISLGVRPPPNLLVALRSNISPLSCRLGTGPCNTTNLTFNLGSHPSGTDPEPGRCRRTDGKKWRCAKEVVPDQKYCERHMNRGRNRCRKPLETRASSLSQPSSVSSTLNACVSPSPTTASAGSDNHEGSNTQLVTSNNSSAPVVGDCSQQQNKASDGIKNCFNLPPGGIATCNQLSFPLLSSGVQGLGNRDFRTLANSTRRDVGLLPEQLLMMKAAGSKRIFYDTDDHLPIMHSVNSGPQIVNSQLKSSGSVIPQCTFPQMKAFGMDAAMSSDGNFVSHLPLSGAGIGSVTGCREYDGRSLRRFTQDWPRSRDPSPLSWPDINEEKMNKNLSNTHLSMSLPTPMDFASNESSPSTKIPVSSQKLSLTRSCGGNLNGGDSTHVGLSMGVGTQEYRHSNWGRVAWENPMGGPLAEALHSGTPRIAKNQDLNLLGDGWDGSPENSQSAVSPTGVLQKFAFGSYSDSSSSCASSPKPAKIEVVHL